jgi:glycosyltransferase involved in cell wall biosynthesis
MDAIADLLTAPIKPWDSLICTSSAVKKNVEAILQAQADYLRERLGISKIELPLLPVIPLGIHTEDFDFTDKQKKIARKKIGVKDDDLVVLYAGRLSFHAKAHPLAMYLGLEAAAKKSKKSVVLVESGWHANSAIAEAFAEAAKVACPSVRVINIDGRKEEGRSNAWSSADIFCSLSDNIQETFGIVPIEAMASGLPVVVSDWDGYKDTVRDGIDGFRIKTMAPNQGLGTDLALRHALGIDTYDYYCGYSSSLVAISVEGVAKAFTKLFESEELRKKMGEAGKKRAKKEYDWKEIIGKYESLWDKQDRMRLAEQKRNKDSLWPSIWPARLDPTISFSHYPTKTLTLETPLRLAHEDSESALSILRKHRNLKMLDFAAYVIPKDEELEHVLRALGDDGKKASEILVGIEEARRPYVLRGLGWLAKIGIIDFS